MIFVSEKILGGVLYPLAMSCLATVKATVGGAEEPPGGSCKR